MNDFITRILWLYILLLLVGGFIGFLKARSKISLIMSAICAGLLALTTLRGILDTAFAFKLANVVLVVLVLTFTVRLARTRKFMPSGLVLAATVAVLAVVNLGR